MKALIAVLCLATSASAMTPKQFADLLAERQRAASQTSLGIPNTLNVYPMDADGGIPWIRAIVDTAPSTSPVVQGLGGDGGYAWGVYVANTSLPVTGTFWQATQPVSVASMPTTPVTGTFWQSTQPVSLASVPTHGVTGTFWQATQPVSLATAPTTPVTGTFWQAQQPVFVGFDGGYVSLAGSLPTGGNQIGHVVLDTGSNAIGTVTGSTVTCNAGTGIFAVSGSFWQSTQPVSGTFWQTTQPVSIASMPTTPVTGTFFQATQPVSVAAAVATTIAASAISGGNPCQNPTATMLGLSGVTSGTASVQLVALNGAQKIYVCSMNITGVSGTTPTFKLQYGTGTACATGTVGIVGPFSATANTVFGFPGPAFAVTPAGQALCYVQTGTTPVANYNLTYVQQ